MPQSLIAVGLVFAISTLASSALAGGQGINLPTVDFFDSKDPAIWASLRTSRPGSPAPLLVRASDLEACESPVLTQGEEQLHCYQTPHGVECNYVSPQQLPIVEDFSEAICAPSAIQGGELSATIDLAAVAGIELDVSGLHRDDIATCEQDCGGCGLCAAVRRTVGFELSMELGGVVLQTEIFPNPGLSIPFDVIPDADVRNADGIPDPVYLNNTAPPGIEELGWFDGRLFDCDASLVPPPAERWLEIERVAASRPSADSDAISIPRASLIERAQRLMPDVLCKPDPSGDCTVTPALAFFEADGSLTRPTTVSFDPAHTTCRVTLRFAEPLTSCNDGIDADGDGASDFPDDPQCLSATDTSEDRFGAWRSIGPLSHAGSNLTRNLHVANFDGDADNDVLATADDDEVVWYENRWAEKLPWLRHALTDEDAFGHGAFIARAFDVDDDGDPDVIAARKDPGEIVWYENPRPAGSANMGHWERHEIATGVSLQSLTVGDPDGDGDVDVFYSAPDAVVVLLRNGIRDGVGWLPEAIPQTPISTASAIRQSDLDGDGDVDVVSVARFSGSSSRLEWWEDEGGSWEPHLIHEGAPVADASGYLYATDLDRDGDPDVVIFPDSWETPRWYENPRPLDLRSAPWVERFLPSGSGGVADLDRDGDWDLLGDAVVQGAVGWLENRLDQDRDEGWDDHLLRAGHPTQTIVESHAAIDVDRDGRLDIVTWSAGEIAWHRQVSVPEPDVLLGMAVAGCALGILNRRRS